MNKILTEPLFYIFFVYGMSFLIMSFVVFTGIRKATSIALVTTFYTLAGFGLIHGLTELTDWLRFILKVSGSGAFSVLLYMSQICLVVSFLLLLQFGVNLLTYRSQRKAVYRWVPAILFIVYIAYLLFARVSDISQAGLIARHGFGILGALLTGIAFFSLSSSMKDVGNTRLTNGLVITGIGFVCYAVFGGLIVNPIVGLPVQLFRAACAFTIAVSSFSILGIFKVSN
jgi:hypothetical protein